MKKIRIGLLGLGQIGGGVYQLLSKKSALLGSKTGLRFEIVKILERDKKRARLVGAPLRLLTQNPLEILKDPSIDVIIELTGGVKPTESWYYEAFKSGKDIITANKALLAEKGEALFKAARLAGCQIFFEASVGGGIPLIKVLREGLVANQVEALAGIVNGTTNYILTQMSQNEMDFADALKLAQEKGYAEADPSFDIQGKDAAHKLVILVRLAFATALKLTDFKIRGIDSISKIDIEYAKRFGYVIKLIAQAKKVQGSVLASVEPLFLKTNHMLAKVDGSFNAVLFQGDETGDVLLYGKGAGVKPTASAVVADLVDWSKGLSSQLPGKSSGKKANLADWPSSRFYLRFSVIDQPGVLSKISQCLGREKVSIADVIQIERKIGNTVPLIMVTHQTREEYVERAVKKISSLSSMRAKPQKIRIED